MAELEGRVAIVTGGASGIGAGIARVLRREGASVVVVDRDGGSDPTTICGDVSERASCRAAVKTVVGRHGRLDALVNGAGICVRGSFTALEEPVWQRVVDVNLKGTYLMSQAALEPMLAARRGAIVNVASVDAKEASAFGAAYGASKFGVIGLTQANAKEFAPAVRVNAVCPGLVRTPLWEPLLEQLAEEQGITPEQAWERAVAAIPLDRPQEPEDVGEAVSFLLSERARNITGIALDVAGGQELR